MRFLLSIIMLFIINLLQAQQELNTIPVNFDAGSGADPVVAVIANKTKDTSCIFLTTNNNSAGYILDQNHKLIKAFNFTKPKSSDKVISGFIKNGAVIFLTGRDMEDSKITVFEYDISSGSFHFNSVETKSRKERALTFVSTGDCVYMISANKNSSTINLYAIKEYDQITNDTISIQPPAALTGYINADFYNTITDIKGLSRAINIGYVEADKKPGLDLLNNSNKVYYRNDSLYFTIDVELKGTLFIALEPISKHINYREISSSKNGCTSDETSVVKYNSFMLKNDLYTITVCNEQLTFAVYNINNGKELFTKSCLRDDSLSFANTPVTQEGAGFVYAKQGERTLDKTKQLIRKMLGGNAIISADDKADENNVTVTIGSYKEVSSGGGAPMMFGGAGGAVPVFISPGSFSHSTWKKTTRFESLLDKKSFEHAEGEPAESLDEKIEEYTKDLKILDGCEAAYTINGRDVYTFYNHKKHNLKIIGW